MHHERRVSVVRHVTRTRLAEVLAILTEGLFARKAV